MTQTTETTQPSRVERRKQRTRASLVQAAQRIFADQGVADASIQEITEAADVGFGSFYNHFASKTELFEVAIAETFERHAAWLASLLADEPDPAAVFTTSMRLTGRLIHTSPSMARIIMHSMGDLLTAGKGHAPHARMDIQAAVEAGRFRVDDPQAALACAAGGLVAALHLMAADPEAAVGDLTDAITFNVLMMFRMDEAEARRLIQLPLPVEEPPVLFEALD